MTPKTLDLLATLRTLDVKLWAEDGQLRYSAPPGKMTTDLRSDLINHKSELLLFFETIQRTQQQQPTTIKPASRQQPLPLSFAQQRLWFLDKLSPGTPTYNIPLAVQLTGSLNVAALQTALQTVVDRHEALRTVFVTKRGRPFQKIAPQLPIPLPLVDLSDHPHDARQARAQALATQYAQHRFDLASGALIQAHLIRLEATQHIFMLVIHHTVFDGWSEEILFRELSAVYAAIHQQKPAHLPPVPMQYADFALWQQKWLASGGAHQQEQYWQKQLSPPIPALSLPTNFNRPRTQTAKGAHHYFTLPADLTADLKKLSRQEGTTLFALLLAAFKVLLYRYTGQTDILVGSPIANRTKAEVEDVIGFFVNTIVFRTHLGDNPTFRTLLHQVKEHVLNGYTHQDLPFDRVVDLVHPERDLSYNPLFQVMFAAQSSSLTALTLPDLQVDWFTFESGFSLFDLSLDVEERGETIQATLEYSTDLFAAETMVRMASHYEVLLRSIVARPSEGIDTLNILPAAERQLLLSGWNDQHRDYEQVCIHHLFERQVAATPTAVAVVYGADRLTYAELNARANQLAHYLQAQGVGPETAVAIYLERSVEMMIAVLAVLKAGGAYVPLNLASPKERLADILDDVAAVCLLSQTSLATNLPDDDGRILYLDTAQAQLATYSDANPVTAVTPDNLAYTIYTSGSTGRPKGVLVAHKNFSNTYFAWNEVGNLRHNIKNYLQLVNFSFDVFGGEWTRALCSGGKLVIVPSEHVLVPEELYALMRREEIECAEFVPVILRQLMDYLIAEGKDLSFMRLILAGSDNWYVGEYRKLSQLCGPNTRIINGYGLTETTIDSTHTDTISESLPDDLIVPVGKPFPNMQLYILDRHLQPVPLGVLGEVYVGGKSVGRGYLNRPQLTAERFIPNPFSTTPGERLYRSGDLARYHVDGSIELVGRIDHQIKIRGLRVELGEIESLIDSHPRVRKSVVVLTPQQQLAAYFVTANGQTTPTQTELKTYLKALLPDYMVPYAYVPLAQFPLTSSGKINRSALPEITGDDLASQNQYIPPRDALETKLVQIWQSLLNVQRISLTSNFFDLGGHSLLAVRLISRIERELGVDLPLASLFEHASVAELATLIRQQGSATAASLLVTLQADGEQTPLFFVHPIGGTVFCYLPLAHHLGQERPFYALQSPHLVDEQLPANISQLAARYIQAIQEVQPEGPYLLGGWSVGGVFAAEIAHQLRQQGHEVARLLLLDSYLPSSSDLPSETHLLWAEFLHNMSQTAAMPIDEVQLAATLSQLSADEQARHVLVLAQRLNLLPADYQLKELLRLFAAFGDNARAAAAYQVSYPLGEEAVLLQTAATPPTQAETQKAQWEATAVAPLKTIVVSGDHFTFLTEPNVAQLATILQKHLPK